MTETFKLAQGLLFTAFLAFCSCSNDLDLVDPGSSIPVVYAVLNPSDRVCYVTLSKSIPSETDVTDILKTNSQMRVDDAEIILEAWGSGYKLWETGFSLVDNHITGNGPTPLTRSCYKTDKVMNFSNLPVAGSINSCEYDYFRLLISSPQFDKMAYSRISLIKGPQTLYPQGSIRFNLYGEEKSYFKVQVKLNEAKYGSLSCRFYYDEYTNHWEEGDVPFVVKKNIAIINDTISMRLYEDFFNKLASAIPENENVKVRLFKYMDFTFTLTDDYFYDYYATYINVANSDMNVYTNITNGYGFFSCARSVDIPGITFDPQTLDSLYHGRLTRELHFKAW
jgi:hypothetical protein